MKTHMNKIQKRKLSSDKKWTERSKWQRIKEKHVGIKYDWTTLHQKSNKIPKSGH